MQRNALLALGVDDEHIFVDHGLTETNRACPGLHEAMAAVGTGDTLVVSKFDRRARSLPDARDIADELTAKGVSLSLGGSTYLDVGGALRARRCGRRDAQLLPPRSVRGAGQPVSDSSRS